MNYIPNPHFTHTPKHRQAQALFDAPRVVVSHQTQADPVLCYGNRKALALWEMDLATLTSTPSRLTAEPVERAERQRLLDTGACVDICSLTPVRRF